MDKLVSIILLNYNNNQHTLTCLKSLKNQTYNNFEIILLDNGSKDQLYTELKRQLAQFDNLLDIKLDRINLNLFFTAGANRAMKKANGKYICLLNNDVIVSDDFIEKMVAFLDTHPLAGMITPKIKFYNNKNIIWNAGSFLNFKTTIIVMNRGYLELDPNNEKYVNPEKIGFAPGTAVFIKKKVIEEIGWIDEIFLLYHEDPDWNLRAQRKGYISYFVPTTIVYHNVPLGKRKSLINFFFFKRNSQILIWKYACLSEILIFYCLLCFTNFFEILFYICKRRKNLVKIQLISIIKGFKIGIRKRTNRSCKKHILKDYRYAKSIENLDLFD